MDSGALAPVRHCDGLRARFSTGFARGSLGPWKVSTATRWWHPVHNRPSADAPWLCPSGKVDAVDDERLTWNPLVPLQPCSAGRPPDAIGVATEGYVACSCATRVERPPNPRCDRERARRNPIQPTSLPYSRLPGELDCRHSSKFGYVAHRDKLASTSPDTSRVGTVGRSELPAAGSGSR
jgi:hypothetical protein